MFNFKPRKKTSFDNIGEVWWVRSLEPAKGTTLDRIGQLYCVIRKRLITIPLLFGWKLVKEESDEDYRKIILEFMEKAFTYPYTYQGKCQGEKKGEYR